MTSAANPAERNPRVMARRASLKIYPAAAYAPTYKRGADGIERQKLAKPHSHAAGQRRRHGVDPRNELGKQQRLLAAPVKVFGRAQNASFRIRRKPAQDAEERPAADSSHEVKKNISPEHRDQSHEKDEMEMQLSVGRHCARGQDGQSGRERKANRLRKAYRRQ